MARKSRKYPNIDSICKPSRDTVGYIRLLVRYKDSSGSIENQKLIIRLLAKLEKAVKIADTSNQRKAKRETMPTVAIAFRENRKPFNESDSVFNRPLAKIKVVR